MTPLHYAALHGWALCVKLLLQREAQVTTDADNMTPPHYAVVSRSIETVQAFIDAGVSSNTPVARIGLQPQYQEGRLLYLPIRGLQSSDSELDSSKGFNLLHRAVLIGSAAMTVFLLQNGADPNAISEHHETPLHVALRRDIQGPLFFVFFVCWFVVVFCFEISLHVIGLEDEQEFSETSERIEAIRMEILQALLREPHTDINAQDSQRASPLHCVRYGKSGSAKVVQELVRRGANVLAVNLHGETALHIATRAGDANSADTLIRLGSALTATECRGINALHCAAQSGDVETLKIVLQHMDTQSISPVTTDKNGRNSLHHLVSCGFFDDAAIRANLESGVPVNATDNTGYSPLARFLESFFLFFLGCFVFFFLVFGGVGFFFLFLVVLFLVF